MITISLFLKNNVMIQILQIKTSSILNKTPFLAHIFYENIFKIMTSSLVCCRLCFVLPAKPDWHGLPPGHELLPLQHQLRQVHIKLAENIQDVHLVTIEL
jgi:hypothetical protein